jgi:two-component system C4-dicarboxylate transport sensor histidine kinase DctB
MREWSSAVVDAPRFVLVHTMTELPSLVNIKRSAETGSVTSTSTRWLVRGTAALALVVAASWLGYAVAFYRGLDHLHVAAKQRLAV